MDLLNKYFETPFFLTLILVLTLIVLCSHQRGIRASSKTIFFLIQNSRWQKFKVSAMFLLAPTLIFVGLVSGIAALADPKSAELKVIKRLQTGRVAIIINDISGSMTGVVPNSNARKIDVLKSANEVFLDEFCGPDKSVDGLSKNLVGLVMFSDNAEIHMPPTQDCKLLYRRIRQMQTQTATSIEKGLWTGLALLIEWVDRGKIIPREELQLIRASLYERKLRLPSQRKEFCERYKGLSLLLFTDGDFLYVFGSREAALLWTQTQRRVNMINPFNVIDLAKSLCIRTYFWSLETLPESYKEAFSSPKGTGFAVSAAGMSAEDLAASYKEVAQKEAGELTIEEIITHNSLKKYFMIVGATSLFFGVLALWSKNMLRHSGKEEP